jgi:hypothetical protein
VVFSGVKVGKKEERRKTAALQEERNYSRRNAKNNDGCVKDGSGGACGPGGTPKKKEQRTKTAVLHEKRKNRNKKSRCQ